MNVSLRLLSSLLLVAPLVAAAVGVQVSPDSTTPGGQVTVTGTGFDCATPELPSPGVQVYASGPEAGPAETRASVVVEPDVAGYFSTPLTIPPTAPPGRYTVGVWCATGTHDGPGITRPLTVTAPPEQLRLSAGSVTAGGSVTATGRWFLACAAAGSRVTIRFDDGATLTGTTLDGGGGFRAGVPIPAGTSPGRYLVAAECTAAGTSEYATAALTVTAIPRTTTPTTTTPGTTEPGTTEPGTTEPGTTEPGTTEPGTTPGTTGPGTSVPRIHVSGPDPERVLGLFAVVAVLVGGAVLVRRLTRRPPSEPVIPTPPPKSTVTSTTAAAVIHAVARPPEVGPARLRTTAGRTLDIRVRAGAEPGPTRVRQREGDWSQ